MVCKNCLIETVCKVACDKLIQGTNADELYHDMKLFERVLNSQKQYVFKNKTRELHINSGKYAWFDKLKTEKFWREFG